MNIVTKFTVADLKSVLEYYEDNDTILIATKQDIMNCKEDLPEVKGLASNSF